MGSGAGGGVRVYYDSLDLKVKSLTWCLPVVNEHMKH